MTRRSFKIGITGTHSTGKSTFVNGIEKALKNDGFDVGRVDDLATRASDLGFPILRDHTFESTLWIMAECMRQEAELALSSDVIIVDRAVPDAFGYLLAALQISGRKLDRKRLEILQAIAGAHVRDYDFLVMTELNQSIPLGEGRDPDSAFREAAASQILKIVDEIAPGTQRMNLENQIDIINQAISAARKALSPAR
ncbi:MAG: AAA family ATPase [Methylovirgula sp.]|uniref:AAA family ATPase n=1 Tax=Methylovirgula sp. TaxID=1978224 RepID=UPI0030761175